MRAFIIGVAAAIVIALAGAVILNTMQRDTTVANTSTTGARI
jgi:hypothetical protein